MLNRTAPLVLRSLDLDKRRQLAPVTPAPRRYAPLGRLVGVAVAMVLTLIVIVEVAVLVSNRFKCPLTDVAARYTDDRRDNFDIYLPLWLARYNKHIFGSLFVAATLFTVIQWTRGQ